MARPEREVPESRAAESVRSRRDVQFGLRGLVAAGRGRVQHERRD